MKTSPNQAYVLTSTALGDAVPSASRPPITTQIKAKIGLLFNTKKKIISFAVVAAIALGTLLFFLLHGIEDTDDAQIAAHVATLSAKVPGLVTEVLVEENQKVKKGQVLVKLDPRDYLNSKNQIESEISSLDAQYQQSEKNWIRARNLFAQGAISTQDKENAESRYNELKAKTGALKAQLDQTLLNLEYSTMVAPADGTVGRKAVEPGNVVTAGTPLLSFVDARQPWVTANFKETQLRKMKVGDKAKFEIDSISGHEFEGEVESVSPGTGATFALIPPENATGNYTKIVQRVPVRIRFNPESIKGYEDRIVPGLSVDVKVYLQ